MKELRNLLMPLALGRFSYISAANTVFLVKGTISIPNTIFDGLVAISGFVFIDMRAALLLGTIVLVFFINTPNTSNPEK